MALSYPYMYRLRELVVDHCPITPLGIQTVVECCQDLETMVVAGEQTVILENAEVGGVAYQGFLPDVSTLRGGGGARLTP